MPLRVGFVTAAHLHVWSYVASLKTHPLAESVGVWDENAERGVAFSEKSGLPYFQTFEELLDAVDAVVIVSENVRHTDHAVLAAGAGKHVLCEKPLANTKEDGERMIRVAEASGVVLMTAFPCRYSPAYARLKERVEGGEIGAIRAICATNRGRCPFGWFVQPELSGGGAMIDHVVHVADLFRDLLGEEPARVQAQTGSNMYGQAWDDTAMVTVEFPSGIFATLDSSWSRPQTFRTWGDVTMTVVGEGGLIELDMFGQGVGQYGQGTPTHSLAAYGSNLDELLVDDFVRCCLGEREVTVTGFDGLQAARVAFAGYQSVREGRAVDLVAI